MLRRVGWTSVVLLLGLVLVACSDDGGGGSADPGGEADLGRDAVEPADLGAAADAEAPSDVGELADQGINGDSGVATDVGGADSGASIEDAGPAEDLGGGDDAATDSGGGAEDLGGGAEDLGGGEEDLGGGEVCAIPVGDRYRSTCGLEGRALLAELGRITAQGHRERSYSDARLHLFTELDVQEDDGDLYVECIYTGDTYGVDGRTLPSSRVVNTEHSWPRSWGATEDTIREADLHHLFVVDARVNSTRGSYLYGDTDCDEPGGGACVLEDGGSAMGGPDRDVQHPGRPGTNIDFAEYVFEVRPEYRGDVARAQLYFATRYPEQSTDASFPVWVQEYLRAWHEQDPPDERELERNDGVQAYQGNRNPYVDHPDFVDRIGSF